MMFPSHLLATVLLAFGLGRVVKFGPREWALALAFGVAIDLDHLLQMPRFAAEHGGWSAFLDPALVSAWGADWQGFMHGAAGGAVAVGAAVAFRSAVPVAFWGLHMVQDFVVARHFVHFGSGLELAIDAALLALVLLSVRAGAGAGAGRYVRDRLGPLFASVAAPAAPRR